MASKWQILANEIASLDEREQRAVLERVAELNFRRGLNALSDQYRERLRQAGRIDQTAEEVLAELRRLREELAASDYPH